MGSHGSLHQAPGLDYTLRNVSTLWRWPRWVQLRRILLFFQTFEGPSVLCVISRYDVQNEQETIHAVLCHAFLTTLPALLQPSNLLITLAPFRYGNVCLMPPWIIRACLQLKYYFQDSCEMLYIVSARLSACRCQVRLSSSQSSRQNSAEYIRCQASSS
jgi:hypothetical protein